MVRRVLDRTHKGARKVVVAVVGGTVVLLGIAMIVLPGPALLVIPLGLGVLAIEFANVLASGCRVVRQSASTHVVRQKWVQVVPQRNAQAALLLLH